MFDVPLIEQRMVNCLVISMFLTYICFDALLALLNRNPTRNLHKYFCVSSSFNHRLKVRFPHFPFWGETMAGLHFVEGERGLLKKRARGEMWSGGEDSIKSLYRA